MAPFDRSGALRKVFLLGRKLGFDQDAIRTIAASLLGIPSGEISFAKLSNAQLSTLLDNLTAQAPSGPTPVKNSASHRQLWKLRQLEQALGMHTNPQRLAGLIRRQTRNRKSTLAELTTWEASGLIETLKAMESRPEPEPAPEPPPESNVRDIFPDIPNRASYSVSDLVKYLSVSKQTVYRLIERGDLTAIQTGACIRIPRTGLLTFLAASRITPSKAAR